MLNDANFCKKKIISQLLIYPGKKNPFWKHHNYQHPDNPLHLYLPGLPQSCLAWVPPSTQVHSGLAPSTQLYINPQGHSCTQEVVICLFWRDRNLTWPWNQSQPPAQPNQLSNCVILPSRLCFLFVCFCYFVVATHRRVEMWLGALHLCLSSEAFWWHL